MKVICADSTRPDSWAEALGGVKADALLTDPPYCLLTRRRKRGDLRDPKGKKNEGDEVRRFEDVREYRAFTQQWMTQAFASTKPEGAWVVWTNLLGKAPIIDCAMEVARRKLLGEFVWAKRTRQSDSGEELLRVVEVALVFRAAPLEQLGPDAKPICWAAVAGYDDDGEAARWGNHPNHKPFGVLDPLVRTWSRAGDVVIDPFSGSGSIGAAAKRLGRDPVCIEKLEPWAKRVGERLAQENRR